MENDFQTPLEIRNQIWKELTRCVHDKHHAWRTPVLSTCSIDGGVNSRTVVLRRANQGENNLLIYTDERSLKVSELRKNSQAIFVFWSPRLRWQLRINVDISILTTGPIVESLWSAVSQTAAKSDYINPTAPGSELVTDAKPLSINDSLKHHFAVLIGHISEMDWLELSRKGHRRAKIVDDSFDWLAP